ncbi:unnamed protein product, partial [Allacma fusca]
MSRSAVKSGVNYGRETVI